MSHHHLAFKSTHGLNSNAYDNEYGSTAERKSPYSAYVGEDYGEYRHESQEYRAYHRYLGQRILYEVRGRLTGSVSGDSAVVFLQVVGDLNGIELNSYIEVVETDDENKVQYRVQPARSAEQSYEAVPERGPVSVDAEEIAYRGRKGHDRHRKDDRHNARHSHLNGNVTGLTAVHLSAYDSLCVLNGDTSFRVGHQNYQSYHSYIDYKDYGNQYSVFESLSLNGHEQTVNIVGDPRYDTCEQDYGYTVSYSLFAYLVTEPDNKGRACNKADDYNDRGKNTAETAFVLNYTAVAKGDIEGDSLKYRQTQRNEFIDLVELFPALVALFCKTLKRLYGNCQQLNYDRRVDVRCDGHCKQCTVTQRAACHSVPVGEQVSVGAVHSQYICDLGRIQKRNEYACAETEDQYDKQCIKYLFTQIGDLPRVAENFKHLDHLCLSACAFDFSLGALGKLCSLYR